MAKTTVEQQMAGIVGQVSEIQQGVTYSPEPTITGRPCNMVEGCEKDAEFTAVDNSPEARQDEAKTSKGEPVVHDACEEHAPKIWRQGLQVIPINAHLS